MALPAYTTPLERIWHYAYLFICGLVFFFLIAPIVVIMPLSLMPCRSSLLLKKC